MIEGNDSVLLRPSRPVGIVGYGAYVPMYRLPAREVARVWSGRDAELPIKEKAVAGLDEDTASMSIEAARNALARARIDPRRIRAVWVGSESHPYAVKPTSTIVAEAFGENFSSSGWTEHEVCLGDRVRVGTAHPCQHDRVPHTPLRSWHPCTHHPRATERTGVPHYLHRTQPEPSAGTAQSRL